MVAGPRHDVGTGAPRTSGGFRIEAGCRRCEGTWASASSVACALLTRGRCRVLQAREDAALADVAKEKAEVEAALTELDAQVREHTVALDDVTRNYNALVSSQDAMVGPCTTAMLAWCCAILTRPGGIASQAIGDTMARFDELEVRGHSSTHACLWRLTHGHAVAHCCQREHQMFDLQHALEGKQRELQSARDALAAAQERHRAENEQRSNKRKRSGTDSGAQPSGGKKGTAPWLFDCLRVT